MQKKTRNKGGTPSGNHNARKHGLYSRCFLPAERYALDHKLTGRMQDEIELLRLIIASATDSLLDQPAVLLPFRQQLDTLHAIALTVSQLADYIQASTTVYAGLAESDQQWQELFDRIDHYDPEKEQPPSPPTTFVPLENAGPFPDYPLAEDSVSPPPIIKKTSGAQPGNSNAHKHGFYARAFSRSEKSRLSRETLGDLQDEASLLRVLVFRIWASFSSLPPGSLPRPDYLLAYRRITHAISVLKKIQRIRQRFFSDEKSFEHDFWKAIDQANQAQGWPEDL